MLPLQWQVTGRMYSRSVLSDKIKVALPLLQQSMWMRNKEKNHRPGKGHVDWQMTQWHRISWALRVKHRGLARQCKAPQRINLFYIHNSAQIGARMLLLCSLPAIRHWNPREGLKDTGKGAEKLSSGCSFLLFSQSKKTERESLFSM